MWRNKYLKLDAGAQEKVGGSVRVAHGNQQAMALLSSSANRRVKRVAPQPIQFTHSSICSLLPKHPTGLAFIAVASCFNSLFNTVITINSLPLLSRTRRSWAACLEH